MFNKLKSLVIGIIVVGVTILASGLGVAEPPPHAPVRDPEHRISKRVESWVELKRHNLVMQRRDYSCGAAALATIVRYYWGDPVTEEYFLDELDKLLTPEEAKDRVKNGLGMSDLRRVAVKTGYQAVAGKLKFAKLVEAKVPLIVGLTIEDYDHFVVYRGTDYRWVYLADPIRGNVRVSIPVFLKQWQQNAILAIHKPGEKVKKQSPLSVKASEIELGELNRQLIRQEVTRRPVRLPQPVIIP